MKHNNYSGLTPGFALPTVMIASVVMLMVLLSGLVSASSVNTSLKSQYKTRLASQAAEAGVVHAKACIEKEGGITWTSGAQLKPNTNCFGAVQFPCDLKGSDSRCYIASDQNFTTSYSVSTSGGDIMSSGTMSDVKTSQTTATTAVSSEVAELKSKIAAKQVTNSTVFGVGSEFSCSLNLTGQIYCAGSGVVGKLGDGLSTDSSTPRLVVQGARPAGVTFKQLNVGNNAACTVGSDNKGYCWGQNNWGQLGDGNPVQKPSPVAVVQTNMPVGATFKSIQIGGLSACGLASNDLLYCWGYGISGQLGYAASSPSMQSIPVPILTTNMPGGATIKSYSVGASHACAIASDDKAYCWGANTNYEVGNGNNTQQNIPVAVDQTSMPAGVIFKSISAGNGYTCGLASDARIYCWGANTEYQLGNGTNTSPVVRPSTAAAVTQPASPNSYASVATSRGINRTCATTNIGKVYCWGAASAGEIGNAQNAGVTSPTLVNQGTLPAYSSYVAVATNQTHVCALTVNAKLYCWGSNSKGQFGAASPASTNTAVAAAAFSLAPDPNTGITTLLY